MTSVLDRAIRLHRSYIRRHGLSGTGFLLHPDDDRKLGNEMRWLTPITRWPAPDLPEPTGAFIKGLPVYADTRVPRGWVVLLR